MYSENDKIESDLVNSYAWDTAIVFIEKYAEGRSNYANQSGRDFSSSRLDTGKAGDVVCNIYDIAANCYELTTEWRELDRWLCFLSSCYKGWLLRSNVCYSS